MIAAILLYPLIAAPLCFFLESKTANRLALVLYAVIFAAGSIVLSIHPVTFTAYFGMDPLNTLFLSIMAFLFLAVSVYNIVYFNHSEFTIKEQTEYTVYFLFFIGAMAGVIFSTHLALLWVFVEATTLFSAPLIYAERSRSSLEAAWKYIFICSIGISLAFVGIILLSIGTGHLDSLFFADLYRNAGKINPFWLKLAFPFILVGLGTKMGLAPVHAWLPDAHSEAPSPVSAMLSGALLNTALLGILRVSGLMTLAHLEYYSGTLLMVMGLLSLLISAIFILRTNNYKRMLAYSSIENMGIISIGAATGGIGTYAAMLHMVAHSFTKGAFFLTAGNIVHRFKTKEIEKTRGILQADGINGWLWLACFVAISGIPPFPSFISEFLLIKGFFEKKYILPAILFFLLLTIILYGMGKAVFHMSFGPKREPVSGDQSPALTYLPPVIILLLLLFLGFYMPDYLGSMLQKAADALNMVSYRRLP
ncbi:MAG: proton-conducting transporter membrane subunit [Candidatus Omnitrophota bacterium]